MTATLLRDAPATPLAASLDRLETLVSPLTGIVRELHPLLAATDDPFVTVIGVRGGDDDAPAGERSSGGYSIDPRRARAAALGEAAERYAGAHVPDEELHLASAAELGPAAVDPCRFALFARRQHTTPGFPFVPFERTTPVRWVRGFSLPDAAEAFLPAQLVYLPWGRLAHGEAPIGHATSSGLACGATLEEAALGGLLELVERDAFMLAWANRLALARLDWGDEPTLAELARAVASASGECAVLDLSIFLGVPAAAAVLIGDGDAEPAIAVGAGAAPTIADAVGKAVAEAFAVRAWGRDLLQTGAARRPLRAADVQTFRDHIAFYATAERARAARFLIESDSPRPLAAVAPLEGETPLDWIRAVATRLAAQEASAYAVDVTTRDLRDAGLHVVKVVAPELCALDVRHDARFLGGRRLYELPHRLGLRPKPLAWNEVNPDPHPFP